MKKIIGSIIFVCATFAITNAHAAAVMYQMTGTYAGELVTDAYHPTEWQSAPNSIFTDSPTIAISFSYDSDTPYSGYVYVTSPFSLPATAAFYNGSISNISGSVAGHIFSADTADTVVGNSNIGDASTDDFITHNTGVSVNGFDVGSYRLSLVAFGSVGDSGYLDSEALPTTLTLGSLDARIALVFFDPDTATLDEVIFNTDNITPVSSVPIPAAAWLMGSSLLGLAGIARRRKA